MKGIASVVAANGVPVLVSEGDILRKQQQQPWEWVLQHLLQHDSLLHLCDDLQMSSFCICICRHPIARRCSCSCKWTPRYYERGNRCHVQLQLALSYCMFQFYVSSYDRQTEHITICATFFHLHNKHRGGQVESTVEAGFRSASGWCNKRRASFACTCEKVV